MNKIDFEVITNTYSMGRNNVATRFKVKLNVGDDSFYSKEEFETEEAADAKIESLKSFLKPKPKEKKKRIGRDIQTGELKEI